MNPVFDVIYNRRSIRSYKSDHITPEQLDNILSAGLWAPTARNEQEIKFVAVQDGNILEELQKDFLSSIGGESRVFHYNAPAFILLFGPKDFEYTEIDAGIAVQNMALAAESIGLNTVIIGILRKMMHGPLGDKWIKRFNIPDDHKFVIGLAVGYKAADTPKKDRRDNRIYKL